MTGALGSDAGQASSPARLRPSIESTRPADRWGKVTDADLLRAHVAGDRDAFAQLFHRHRDRLWAVALRTLADREEAADALQDALLSAHRAAPRFRGEAAVTTWLHRIVVNACLDRIRRRQAHPTVPLPDGSRPAETGRWAGGVEPAAPAPDHDTALVVRQALAQLPMEQRAALVLVDLQGYPVAEVADILGVAEGTVKSRCARGRARLALLLGNLRPPGPVPARPRIGVLPVTTGNLGYDGDVRSASTKSGPDRDHPEKDKNPAGYDRQQAGRDRRPPTPDQAGHTRDQAGHTRDQAGHTRDQAGHTRDQAGHDRKQGEQ